jgi:peptidoglycan/LPS O-acetylase OafA/YrhL
VRRVLGNRVLLWLGMLSYAFYLWHLPILTKLSRGGVAESIGGTAFTILGFICTTAVAAASWYLIERPVQRVLRARERRSPVPSRVGHTPESEGVVQSVADGLNPAGVAVDHLA